jgi:adenylate cyclase
MESSELVELLNLYLTIMTDSIMEFNGTLDKYIGDAIMCFWGAPLSQDEHALFACKCAVRQLELLREFNKTQPENKQINIGIGLNSGLSTVGNMGSQGRMNYTVMGDHVNLASRLEGTNKQYYTEIIISEKTYELIQGSGAITRWFTFV